MGKLEAQPFAERNDGQNAWLVNPTAKPVAIEQQHDQQLAQIESFVQGIMYLHPTVLTTSSKFKLMISDTTIWQAADEKQEQENITLCKDPVTDPKRQVEEDLANWNLRSLELPHLFSPS